MCYNDGAFHHLQVAILSGDLSEGSINTIGYGLSYYSFLCKFIIRKGARVVVNSIFFLSERNLRMLAFAVEERPGTLSSTTAYAGSLLYFSFVRKNVAT